MITEVQWAEMKQEIRSHGIEIYFGDIAKGKKVCRTRLRERLDTESWFQSLRVVRMWMVAFASLAIYFGAISLEPWVWATNAAILAVMTGLAFLCTKKMYEGQPAHTRERIYLDPTMQEMTYYYDIFNYTVGFTANFNSIEDAIYDRKTNTIIMTGDFIKTINSYDENMKPRTKMLQTDTIIVPNIFDADLTAILKTYCQNYSKFKCGQENERVAYNELREKDYNSIVQRIE